MGSTKAEEVKAALDALPDVGSGEIWLGVRERTCMATDPAAASILRELLDFNLGRLRCETYQKDREKSWTRCMMLATALACVEQGTARAEASNDVLSEVLEAYHAADPSYLEGKRILEEATR